MAWYIWMLIIAGAILVLQVIASFIIGDTDLDIDADLGMGDYLSLKGLLHFIIGFSLTLTVMGEVHFTSISIAVLVGAGFVFLLGFLYRFLYKNLRQEMKYQETVENQLAAIYYWDSANARGEVTLTLEGRATNVDFSASDPDIVKKLKSGDKVIVSGTRKHVHFVSFNK